jgi:hypothetical protein
MRRLCVKVLSIGLLGALMLAACGGGNGGGVVASPDAPAGSAPVLTLTPRSIKTFRFTWTDVNGETEYRLLEDPDGSSGFSPVATIPADAASHDLVVSLPQRVNARYVLQACNASGCLDSAPVALAPVGAGGGRLAEAVGYFKPSNTGGAFGMALALSADGNTLAVGAHAESGVSTGIDGDQNIGKDGINSGAVYVFARGAGNTWTQQAYVKASNAEFEDHFGSSVALSANGDTLAVGAPLEDSAATGVNGNAASNSASGSGAVYVFSRSGTQWSQQAYVKASNTEADDNFGSSVALSGDGSTLAVGAPAEDSAATGIDGNQASNGATNSGAVYVFVRNGSAWGQQGYLKASNTDTAVLAADQFGAVLALSADGNTLAVGAAGEDGSGNALSGSGAAYVFVRSGSSWSEQRLIRASNAEANDRFGISLALSGDGNTLVVGANGEDGNNNTAQEVGAVYVYTRSGITWSLQDVLRVSSPTPMLRLGTSLALSADGDTVAVAANAESGGTIGINGGANELAPFSGAVYLFTRRSTAWNLRAYVKASNTDEGDSFGGKGIALSADGGTLAVGAPFEASTATGINGDQSNNQGGSIGAVYLY